MGEQHEINQVSAASLISTEPSDRALSYLRVSKDETAKSTSLAKQRDCNQRAAAALGIPLIDHECDERTGRTFERAGLERLLERFERGEATTLIIFDVDRLSRKFTGYACLRELLHRMGVKIYLSGANAYLSTLAAERVNADLKGLMSEIEWETIRARSGDGLMRKIMEQQRVPGKGQAPYGYCWEGVSRSRNLVIDEAEAAIIRHIFDLYVNGVAGQGPLSMLKIVAWLNTHRDRYPAPSAEHRQSAYRSKQRPADEWVLATVAGVLNRTAYYGEWENFQRRVWRDTHGQRRSEMRPQEERVTVPCPAIISQELWDQAAARRVSRYKHHNRTYAISLMARRLKCECGYSYIAGSGEKDRVSTITGRKLKDKRFWYICHGARKQLPIRTCPSAQIPADQLDPAVWQWVLEHLARPALIASALEAERSAQAGGKNRAREYLAIMAGQRDEIEAELAALNHALAASPAIAHILRRQLDERADLLGRYERDLAELRAATAGDADHATIGEAAAWAERLALAGAATTPEERLRFIEFLDLRGVVGQIPPGGRGVALGEERGPGVYVGLSCRLPISGVLAFDSRQPRQYGRRRGQAPGAQLALPIED